MPLLPRPWLATRVLDGSAMMAGRVELRRCNPAARMAPPRPATTTRWHVPPSGHVGLSRLPACS
eukprot:11755312-Prorocentrum_lima.AAC.1